MMSLSQYDCTKVRSGLHGKRTWVLGLSSKARGYQKTQWLFTTETVWKLKCATFTEVTYPLPESRSCITPSFERSLFASRLLSPPNFAFSHSLDPMQSFRFCLQKLALQRKPTDMASASAASRTFIHQRQVHHPINSVWRLQRTLRTSICIRRNHGNCTAARRKEMFSVVNIGKVMFMAAII